jgi:hypothetical protein
MNLKYPVPPYGYIKIVLPYGYSIMRALQTENCAFLRPSTFPVEATVVCSYEEVDAPGWMQNQTCYYNYVEARENGDPLPKCDIVKLFGIYLHFRWCGERVEITTTTTTTAGTAPVELTDVDASEGEREKRSVMSEPLGLSFGKQLFSMFVSLPPLGFEKELRKTLPAGTLQDLPGPEIYLLKRSYGGAMEGCDEIVRSYDETLLEEYTPGETFDAKMNFAYSPRFDLRTDGLWVDALQVMWGMTTPGIVTSIDVSFSLLKPYIAPAGQKEVYVMVEFPKGFYHAISKPPDVKVVHPVDVYPHKWLWPPEGDYLFFLVSDPDTKPVQVPAGYFHVSFPVRTPSEKVGIPVDNNWRMNLCLEQPYCRDDDRVYEGLVPGFRFNEPIEVPEALLPKNMGSGILKPTQDASGASRRAALGLFLLLFSVKP